MYVLVFLLCCMIVYLKCICRFVYLYFLFLPCDVLAPTVLLSFFCVRFVPPGVLPNTCFSQARRSTEPLCFRLGVRLPIFCAFIGSTCWFSSPLFVLSTVLSACLWFWCFLCFIGRVRCVTRLLLSDSRGPVFYWLTGWYAPPFRLSIYFANVYFSQLSVFN
jgi:hypothetical protein